MSPELFDGRPTRSSDCYALGMVIYEVLSGRVPFFRYHGYAVVAKILKGERPRRPQGGEGEWFMDEIWSILERCWEANPGDRPRIKDVLQCLGNVSGSWMIPSPQAVAGPSTANMPSRNSDRSAEESTDGSE